MQEDTKKFRRRSTTAKVLCRSARRTVRTRPAARRGEAKTKTAPANRTCAAMAERRQCRVMSYNVLADKFTSPAKYFYVAPELLEWPARLELIRAEIERRDPDVLCLQEVDLATAERDFARPGFAVVVQNDRKRSKEHTTGAAVVYRTSDFRLGWTNSRSRALAVELVRVAGGAEAEEAEEKAEAGPPAQAGRLWVGTVHLEGHPDLGWKRLNQLSSLLKHLWNRQSAQLRAAGLRGDDVDPAACATVIAGDFNCTADETAYELLAKGVVRAGASEGGVPVTKADVAHGYRFRSAYSDVLGREPELTFSVGPAGIRPCALDFMFASEPALRAVSVGEPCAPGLVERLKGAGLPDAERGSDHLPISAVYELAQ